MKQEELILAYQQIPGVALGTVVGLEALATQLDICDCLMTGLVHIVVVEPSGHGSAPR